MESVVIIYRGYLLQIVPEIKTTDSKRLPVLQLNTLLSVSALLRKLFPRKTCTNFEFKKLILKSFWYEYVELVILPNTIPLFQFHHFKLTLVLTNSKLTFELLHFLNYVTNQI